MNFVKTINVEEVKENLRIHVESANQNNTQVYLSILEAYEILEVLKNIIEE